MIFRLVAHRHLERIALLIAISVVGGCSNPPFTVVLTYEIDPTKTDNPAAVDLDRVVTVINGRLGNMGRAEKLPNRKIDIGLYGNLSPEESEWMKRLISDSGHLEFRITADPNLEKNETVVKLAKELPPDQKTVVQNGSPVAKW